MSLMITGPDISTATRITPFGMVVEAEPYVFPRRTFKQIKKYICKLHGLSWVELHTVSRVPAISHARHHAYYLGRTERGFKYSMMGRSFGQDHSSAIYGAVAHYNRERGIVTHLKHNPSRLGHKQVLRLPDESSVSE